MFVSRVRSYAFVSCIIVLGNMSSGTVEKGYSTAELIKDLQGISDQLRRISGDLYPMERVKRNNGKGAWHFDNRRGYSLPKDEMAPRHLPVRVKEEVKTAPLTPPRTRARDIVCITCQGRGHEFMVCPNNRVEVVKKTECEAREVKMEVEVRDEKKEVEVREEEREMRVEGEEKEEDLEIDEGPRLSCFTTRSLEGLSLQDKEDRKSVV